MKYLKVWTNFEGVLSPLKDDEIGRLFLHMLRYAATGQEPSEFIGNERFIWPMAKRDIDIAAEKVERLRENGLKGGRPATKKNQTKAKESKNNQSEPEESKSYQIEANESRKEKTRNEKKGNEKISLLSDDDAHAIQSEQNLVLDVAEDAGFQRSNTVRARLIDLYADHGLQKLIDGINECVRHGAVNLAYLEAVLKGQPKKAKAQVVAQDYGQRDYSKAQDELIEEQNREMEEYLKRSEAG